MLLTETHGFVLWGVPRFHRLLSAPKPPAPERKPANIAEPAAPLTAQDKPEPTVTQAA